MKKAIIAMLALVMLFCACACADTKLPEGWEVAEYTPLSINMAWPVAGLADGSVRGFGDDTYFLLCFDGCSKDKELVSRGRGQETQLLFAYMHNEGFVDMGAPCSGYVCADKIDGAWEASVADKDLFINGKYYKSITDESGDYKQTTILIARDGMFFELTASGTDTYYSQMLDYAKLIASTMEPVAVSEAATEAPEEAPAAE